MVTVFCLEPSITLLIDVNSVLVLLCLQRLGSPSLCLSSYVLLFPFFLLIPQSDCDRWRSLLPCQWLPPLLPCLLLVFSCALSNRHCQAASHEFPAPGSDPILLGRLRQCEFFRPLKLSGGQEFIFRAVAVGQRHPHTHKYTHTMCVYKASRKIELSGGNNMFLNDSVTTI